MYFGNSLLYYLWVNSIQLSPKGDVNLILGDFDKSILRFCCKFSMKIIFYPISEHREAKVRRFLGICLYDCFIYRTNLQISSSGNVLERDAILAPVAKQWIAKDIPSYGSQSKRAISRSWVAYQSARKTLTTVLLEWFSPFATFRFNRRRERVKSATQPYLVSSANAPLVGRKKTAVWQTTSGSVTEEMRICKSFSTLNAMRE